MRLKRGVTHTSVSVYPTIGKSLRAYGRHFGSTSRAVQIGVEILYERWRRNEPLIGPGSAAEEEQRKQIKRPLSIDTLPRTEFLIEVLSEPYGSRAQVISTCENVLADLLTSAELLRRKRSSK